jgi:hypothetical protein
LISSLFRLWKILKSFLLLNANFEK